MAARTQSIDVKSMILPNMRFYSVLSVALCAGLAYIYFKATETEGNEHMFKAASIIKAPSGRFIFVGRVPAELCNVAFNTIDAAKIAAVDCMIEHGESFPVNVA